MQSTSHVETTIGEMMKERRQQQQQQQQPPSAAISPSVPSHSKDESVETKTEQGGSRSAVHFAMLALALAVVVALFINSI
jgi:hypothetical protein